MTFPLLKLPFLAYEQVLLNFEVPDLLNKYKKLDCSGGVDLVREDGMLATVVVGENRICFVVWHTRFHPQVNNLYRI
uniref:Uncharacterized protein n=1 Tax=Caenorhabditis tropicalis TaxID=1561998 RepID=A0A1I7TKY7_9PELO